MASTGTATTAKEVTGTGNSSTPTIPIVLRPRFIFGVNDGVSDNVHFVDGQTVLYSAGSHIVFYNMDTHTQKILALNATEQCVSENAHIEYTNPVTGKPLKWSTKNAQDAAATNSSGTGTGIGASRDHLSSSAASGAAGTGAQPPNTSTQGYLISTLCMSRDKKLLAVGMYQQPQKEGDEVDPPIVTIWETDTLKKCKTIVIPNRGPKKILSLSFSYDSVYVLAQTTRPDYSLFAWNWEKGRLHGELTLGINALAEATAVTEQSLLSGKTSVASSRQNLFPTSSQRGSVASTSTTATPRRQSMIAPAGIANRHRSGALPSDNNGGGAAEQRVLEIHQVSFSPYEASGNLICITGTSLFRLVRFTPELPIGLRISGQLQNQFRNFTRHCWLTKDRIATATTAGQIFLMENGELKYEVKWPANFSPLSTLQQSQDGTKTKKGAVDELPTLKEKENEDAAVDEVASVADSDDSQEVPEITHEDLHHQVTSIVRFSSGFVAGTASGRVAIFDSRDGEVYQPVTHWTVDANVNSISTENPLAAPAIHSMCLSPIEDMLVLQQGTCRLMATEFGLPLAGAISTDFNNSEIEYKSVPIGFPGHSRAIRDIAVCYRKPMIATCGADRCIRIWNYADLSLDHTQVFNETPVCLTMHPSGHYLAVGFQTTLRLFAVRHDGSLVSTWSVPTKRMQRVQFSQGGQFFVVACDTSLFLYDTWTQELLSKVDAHAGDVKRLVWCERDISLVSIGQSGSVVEWEVSENAIHYEYRLTDIQVHEAESTEDIHAKASLASTLIKVDHKFKNMERPYPMTMKKIRERSVSDAFLLSGEYVFAQAHYEEMQRLVLQQQQLLALQQQAQALKQKNKAKVLLQSPARAAAEARKAAAEKKKKETALMVPTVKEHPTDTLVVGSDGTLRQYTHTGSATYDIQQEWTNLQLLPSLHFMVAAGANGSICTVQHPLVDELGKPSPSVEYTQYSGHHGKAEQILFAVDGKHLFTCGQDGCMIVYRVVPKDAQHIPREAGAAKVAEMNLLRSRFESSEQQGAFIHTDDVLLGADDFKKMTYELQELLVLERETSRRYAEQLVAKDVMLNTDVEATQKLFESQIQELQSDLDMLKRYRADALAKYMQNLEDLRRAHQQEVEDMHKMFSERMLREKEKYSDATVKLQDQTEAWKKAIVQRNEAKEEAIRAVHTIYEERLKAGDEKLLAMDKQMEQVFANHNYYMQDMEELLDDEISDVRMRHELLLHQETSITNVNRRENEAIKKKYTALSNKVADSLKTSREHGANIKNLHMDIRHMQAEAENLRLSIKERMEEEINRDRVIADEKQKLQDVEKSKYILETRIASEKELFEPRESLRKRLREQLEAMQGESKKLVGIRQTKKIDLYRMKERFHATMAQSKREYERKIGFRIALEEIAKEMHDMMGEFYLLPDRPMPDAIRQDPMKLAHLRSQFKKAVTAFYHRHCGTDEAVSVHDLLAAPKGHVKESSPMGDPLVNRVMKLPELLEKRAHQITANIKSNVNRNSRKVASNAATTKPGTTIKKQHEQWSSGDLHTDEYHELIRQVLKSTEPNSKRNAMEEFQYQSTFIERTMLAVEQQGTRSTQDAVQEKRSHYLEQNVLLSEINQVRQELTRREEHTRLLVQEDTVRRRDLHKRLKEALQQRQQPTLADGANAAKT